MIESIRIKDNQKYRVGTLRGNVLLVWNTYNMWCYVINECVKFWRSFIYRWW